jgi:hypothetical protein
MENGEIFKVGRRYYLVAPVCEKVLERLIIAAGRTEDNEENGDLEPNTGDDEPSLGADAPEGDPCDQGEEYPCDDEPSRVVPTGAWQMF